MLGDQLTREETKEMIQKHLCREQDHFEEGVEPTPNHLKEREVISMIRLHFDEEKQELSVQDLRSEQVKTLKNQQQIKRFLHAHGIKLEELVGTIYAEDVTGLFMEKGKVIPFTSKK